MPCSPTSICVLKIKKVSMTISFLWEVMVMVEARAKQIHNKLGEYKHIY